MDLHRNCKFYCALTVRLQSHLQENEQNPIARWILESYNWEVSSFIGIKTFTTILVLGILAWFYDNHQDYSLLIAFGIVLFQTFLLIYLTCF